MEFYKVTGFTKMTKIRIKIDKNAEKYFYYWDIDRFVIEYSIEKPVTLQNEIKKSDSGRKKWTKNN